MDKILPLEERSIYQIYMEGKENLIYKVPVYQRNYAWEEEEITALIKDVYDAYHKSASSPYYIGTLVTYKRGENEYEVIDGQQRLTTIYLILKAFGIERIVNKLTYTARKVSALTLAKLPDFGDEVDGAIRNGYTYARKAIGNLIESENMEGFKQYFLHQVRLIHYKVPKDVDLNHYFEVMNSRGEQLEKHEIVKSTLSQYLKNAVDLATFGRVWEACSEMNIYIQQVFADSVVFGLRMDDFLIGSFDEIPGQDVSEGKETILNLLQGTPQRMADDENAAQTDKFLPIIDFPNLLLVVLKLTLMRDYAGCGFKDVILDDKELLNEFVAVLQKVGDKEKFAKTFIFNLLEAKYLLDNFVVHHVPSAREQIGDNPWQLQYFYKESNHKRYPKNLSQDIRVQKELVHLLSMFEVTFTAKQRKNYLFYCFSHLFGNREANGYLAFLRCLADKYFYDVYLNKTCLNERNQPGPNAFDNAIVVGDDLSLDVLSQSSINNFEDIYQQGKSDIPLFVFNYTDYRLWKKYAEDLKGAKSKKGDENRVAFFKELGCSDFELDYFNNFYFSRTRKSLEHFYPQAKAVGDDKVKGTELSVSQINCFGNFAMIGAEANSSGSNWDPKTKLDHYTDGKSDTTSVASLKFKIMMQMCLDNLRDRLSGASSREMGMEWNADDIQRHQRQMLHIICKK